MASAPRVNEGPIVEVIATPAAPVLSAQLNRSTAIIVDVLRASTTVVTALQAGALRILAVSDPAEALRMRARDPSVLIAGERHGLRLAGFDLGNSPLEYTPERVAGRTIVFTTSNGVPALLSTRDARRRFWGALRNATAVARAASAFRDAIVIVCAGTGGESSPDDLIAAGAILRAIIQGSPWFVQAGTPATLQALALFNEAQADLEGALLRTAHGRTLVDLGFSADVIYAAQLDEASSAVPVVKGNQTVLL